MNINLGLGGRRRRPTQPTNTSSTSTTTGRRSSPDDDWEALDLSSTEYARRRRELMKLINDLKSMGADTMIDLPSIVVIGGQSAGKSSLVEAVSGTIFQVNVPRDSGTCTRCPMEITMSGSTTWSCTIKLRFGYDSGATQQSEIGFGPTITNKDEVDVWLRRAQAAILNPNVAPDSFHTKTIQELRNSTPTNSLKFSRDIVSVFISDPSATDLSFCDLPGLIQNEEQEVVDLVRELTKSYINRPNTIIITTIPIIDDMQNQESVKLARFADPEGERTIGVLTKADMIGEGDINLRQSWLDVIEGRKHQLKHGYYSIRLPNDRQRAEGLSRGAIQNLSQDYFDTTPPWSGVVDRSHFGIRAFVTYVSVLLVEHIRKVIPQLKREVEQLLAACTEELGTLPRPLETDPQVEVLLRVNAFCDDFKAKVSGTDSDKSLVQKSKEHYTSFAQDVRGTAPDFRPFDQPEEYRSIVDPGEQTMVKDSRVRIMGLDDVRQIISESIAWELPGNIPYEAKTRLINQFTALWFAPAEKCLDSVNDVLDGCLRQLIKTHFGRFRILQDRISDLIYPDVIEEHKSKALEAIKQTLALEITPIHTENVKDYLHLREKWLSMYRKARAMPGPYKITQNSAYEASDCERASNISSEREALRCLAQAGYKFLTVHDLARLLPTDEFADELTVMADVRAYFTIACKRIVDHVPLKIQQTLHQALADRLSFGLIQRLLFDTSSTDDFADRMRELVSEDPAIEEKRTLLQTRCTRLQEMRRMLGNFVV